MYPDPSFLDISSTPEGNTNIQALQLNLSLNLSPPEEMLHQLLTAVSEHGGLSQAPAILGMLYSGSCWIPKIQILPWTLVKSVCKVRPLQTHQAEAGEESPGQQISSHPKETIPVTLHTSRSSNIDGSSETHLRLALGPGILQFTSVLP